MATEQLTPDRTVLLLETTYVQNILADMALEALNGQGGANPFGTAVHSTLAIHLEQALPGIMDNLVTRDAQQIAVTALLHQLTHQAAEWQLHEWCAEQIVHALHQQATANGSL